MDRVRPGGGLLFMSGTGGRHAAVGLGLIAAVTAALPALVANLALDIAPVRGQPHRARPRRHPVVGGAARRRARDVDGGQQFTPDAWS
jgi:hypothetical protein